jgi:aminoglycoside phosphotransferase (APT) family kinase protein
MIHARTAGRADIAARFATQDCFFALRISPFLLYTAERHADLAPRLEALAADLGARRTALMHGDISPKNILVGPAGPVFLDAECTAYGDPAFDLAFCLTHLLLKTVWLAPHAEALMASFAAMTAAYQAGADWEPWSVLSVRAATLVSALLLARVDGKSPAPYLASEADKGRVRAAARALLARRDMTLGELAGMWREQASL